MPQVNVCTTDLLDKLITGAISFSSIIPIAIPKQQANQLITYVEQKSLASASSDTLIDLSQLFYKSYDGLRQSDLTLANRYAHQVIRCLATSEAAPVLFARARLYQQGISEVLQADVTKYVRLLVKAANEGHKPAQIQLAEHQCNGLSAEGDILIQKAPSAAVELLESISDYSDAAFALFQLYWPKTLAVEGIQKSAANAVTYALQAAEAGHKQAMFVAFQLHEGGLSERSAEGLAHSLVQQDLTQALKWLEKAAKAGLAEASYKWGQRLETGVAGVLAPHKKAALLYFRQAAAQKHAKAQEAVLRLDPFGFTDDIERLQGTVQQLDQRVLSLQNRLQQGLASSNRTPSRAASSSDNELVTTSDAPLDSSDDSSVRAAAQEERIAGLEAHLAVLQASLEESASGDQSTRSWFPTFMGPQ